MRLSKKLKEKTKNMSISSKLKLISSVTLIIPLTLSIICCTIIFLTFVTGEYPLIINMLEPVENTNYAYTACEYIYENFKKEIVENDNEDIRSLFLNNAPYEQGVVYLQVTKNNELIYHTTSYEKPENFEELYSYVDNDLEKIYTIIDGHIIFRITIEHNNNKYDLFAHGPVRTFYPYEKTSEFYVGFLFTNFMFILFVAVSVMFLSKILNRSIFKRVEYSLNLLSDGVTKLSEGELDYKIIYNRNDEFKPICDSFNSMADKLKESINLIEEKDNNQRAIILGITHDIFSPLTSIKAYVEGLQSGIAKTTDMQKKYLDIINAKTDQIEKTISQMLLYTKIKDESIAINKVKTELGKYIKDFVENNKTDYLFKKTIINIKRCDFALISADSALLSRALVNIIDNSKKHSDKDVCIVEIELIKSYDHCTLIISDNGPGVADNDLEKLFETFYICDKARQNHGKSNGIGLSIVSNIVKKVHNGSIKAENNEPCGLKIIIELPTLQENSNEQNFNN